MGQQPTVEFRAPESFVEDMDDFAERRGMKRSEYIREAIRRQMQHDISIGVKEENDD